MLLLASFVVEMAYRRRRPKVAIWMNFANRTEFCFEPIVGWFVNHHLVGLDTSSCSTGLDVMSEVRSASIKAALHQRIPLSFVWNQAGNHPPFSRPRVYFNFRKQSKVAQRTGYVPGVNRGGSPVSSSSPSQLSRGRSDPSLEFGALFVEVTIKDGCLELSFNCRSGLSRSRSTMQSTLYHWAAVTCLLPKFADQPLSTLQGLAVFRATWQRVKDSLKEASRPPNG
jgi:hypothetical protein